MSGHLRACFESMFPVLRGELCPSHLKDSFTEALSIGLSLSETGGCSLDGGGSRERHSALPRLLQSHPDTNKTQRHCFCPQHYHSQHTLRHKLEFTQEPQKERWTETIRSESFLSKIQGFFRHPGLFSRLNIKVDLQRTWKPLYIY